VSASPVRRQIVAMGGGSFSVEPDGSALDAYVLGLTGKARPKICFVPTASGDAPEYTAKFYDAFARRAEASHLYLFGRPRTDMAKHLASQNIIYVGGGNTANLLAVWRVHGVDRMMRDAWERGVILTGVSAGMICWFECGVTDSFGPLAALRDGLGLLSGSACPHYDGERDRRPTYQRLVRGGFPAGYAADDGAALHFVDTDLVACVASRPKASGYRVRAESETVTETPLSVRLLD
jgi:dipeptidase E